MLIINKIRFSFCNFVQKYEMGRLLSGLALLIFFMGCTEKLPEGVVSRKAMPDLLFDVHVLDGQLSAYPIDSARMLIESSYDVLFQRHGIDSAQFRKTMEYYAGHPILLREIYTVVNDRVQKYLSEEQAVMAEKYRQEQLADSLIRVHRQDSLAQIARDSTDLLMKRHLLFNHQADSAIDKPIPVTFDRYSTWFLENFGLEKLFFFSVDRGDDLEDRPEEEEAIPDIRFPEVQDPKTMEDFIDFNPQNLREEMKLR